MGLFKTIKRYEKRLEKRFTKQISRTQLNFACDQRIVGGLKLLARDVEVPVYVIAEHLLQLGMSEVAVILEDESLKEELCRHLVQYHLLVPVTELEPPSDGALRARKVIDFLNTVETLAGNPKALAKLLAPMIKGAAAMGIVERQRKAEPRGWANQHSKPLW